MNRTAEAYPNLNKLPIEEPDANRAAANTNRLKVGNTLSVRCGWVP
jgi:hypothetical protein